MAVDLPLAQMMGARASQDIQRSRMVSGFLEIHCMPVVAGACRERRGRGRRWQYASVD